MSRGDLTEAEWRVLRGLLPIDAAIRGRGRPPDENRSIVNGILWRLRRWSEAGVWAAVSVTRAEIMADTGHFSIDRTTVRTHGSAAGGAVGQRS